MPYLDISGSFEHIYIFFGSTTIRYYRLYTSESDVYIRHTSEFDVYRGQILTYKDGLRTERVHTSTHSILNLKSNTVIQAIRGVWWIKMTRSRDILK